MNKKLSKPLPELLRPQTLDDFVGQEHLVGKGGPIRSSLQNNRIYSMVFWGPPGSGKTTLARVIANQLNIKFYEISPTTAGVKDIKAIIEQVKAPKVFQKSTQDDLFTKDFADEIKTAPILFVDEIHRFNKAQQDYLLPHVEDGTIVLIGATTENPSFEIVSPLLSRTTVYVFEPLDKSSIQMILDGALDYLEKEGLPLKMTYDAKEFLVNFSNGDARNILNALDAIVMTGISKVDAKDIENVIQAKFNQYDKKGEEHYNTISAFIKSMRASDVDAALYYLGRMVNGGEDPKFIARRMVVFASEDIGLAAPNALTVANAVFRACETIGYPECQINLAHGTAYLAKAPKDRSAYNGYFSAKKDVTELGNLPIPMKVRNAPTKLMKDLGYGKGYEAYPEKGSYLPEELQGKKYYKS